VADTCVSRVPVFAGLSGEDQQRVANLARPGHLRAAESLPADVPRLVVLHTGRLKIVRLSADGSEQIVRVLGPGDFTGETSVFTGDLPEGRATALEDSRVCVFRHDDLRALISAHPEIGWRMLTTLSRRLAETEHRLGSLTTRDVEGRLAEYLLGLPSAWDGGVATVRLPLAKKDVASLLDASPESLSRALASLARQGVITVGPGRAISITQPDRLQVLGDDA
jgi:CRP/FNR family transcriptional regulator, anaerobic regulatory protein